MQHKMKGIYVLILKLGEELDIHIGRLGLLHFRKGFYAYVGSALGTGGFKRADRHFKITEGKNPTRKWHIDYLLAKSRIMQTILLPTEEPIECLLARAIIKISGISIISGFGCSDCSCDTHLFYTEIDPKNLIIKSCKEIGACDMIIKNYNK